jgi:hypothetical protein
MKTQAPIKSLKQLQPGSLIWITSAPFEATNPAIFVSHDRTGMNRDIGYAQFDRGRQEPEFAVWQHELDAGRTKIGLRDPSEAPVGKLK